MIVNVICACIETLVQMFIYFYVFIKIYGTQNKLSLCKRIVILALLAAVYIFLSFNNVINLFSISAIISELPILTILLWTIVGREFIRAFVWCFFNMINFVLLKLPTLVILGVVYDEVLSEMTLLYNKIIWARIINCGIFVILLIVWIKYRHSIIRLLKSMSYQRIVLLFVGIIEYIIILYIMYLGWNGFTIQTFILTICLIFLLFMLIICLIVILEYQVMVRINCLLKAKDSSMRANYFLINQEIERNRKINHDKKYDFEYLYHCFEQRDYDKGLSYIRQKEDYYNLLQKNLTWTGYGSIDFLLNRAKARADEKEISFTIKVDIVEIPIEEYDFFSVLSNLLDNAIEASMQNKEGERYIELKILSLNNVFKLRLENSYLTEPIMKGKHFISSKCDNSLHGWGVENVKEVVNKYNGTLDINYGNGIFLVNLIVI